MKVQQPSAEDRFGSALKAARSAQGISQRALASAMNDYGFGAWVQSTVTKTEAGERPLRLNEALALCAIVGLEPREILKQIVTPESAHQRALRENREGRRIVQERIGELEAQLDGLRKVEGDLAERYELLVGERSPTLADFYNQPSDAEDAGA